MAESYPASCRPFRILFLCTGNSCRSQMAEGFARVLCPDALETYSAGIAPGELNPLAVRCMAEAGIDISDHRAKGIADLRDIRFDVVVTVCDAAHEACPVFPEAPRTLHQSFDDPPRLAAAARSDAEALPHYRRVRDEIRAFVEALPERLFSRATAPGGYEELL